MFSGTVGIKVSDDLVLPVMVYWLSRSVLSYLLRVASFNLPSDCASAKCTCRPIQFNFI